MISEFVAREKQTSLVTPQKLGKIGNNNFDQTLCLEWAKLLLKLKEDCKGSFVSSDVCQNFEEAWQTSYGEKFSQSSVHGARSSSPCTGQSDFLARSQPRKLVVVEPIK